MILKDKTIQDDQIKIKDQESIKVWDIIGETATTFVIQNQCRVTSIAKSKVKTSSKSEKFYEGEFFLPPVDTEFEELTKNWY